MKKFIGLLILFSIILLSGCSKKGVEPNVYMKHMSFTVPELNTIGTVEVGENMYEKINRFNKYNVQLKEPAVAIYENKLTIKKELKFDVNTIYQLKELEKEKYYTICKKNSVCLIDIGNTGYFSKSSVYYKDKKYSLNKPVPYELISAPVYAKDSFRYVVLYQGKIDNKIKLSFREFKDNLSRPAFTQNIEYEFDNTKNTIVGFKGLRIEIIEATNVNITYQVIQDYK